MSDASIDVLVVFLMSIMLCGLFLSSRRKQGLDEWDIFSAMGPLAIIFYLLSYVIMIELFAQHIFFQ